jgi:tetratricopeptide (TPR) repeat protein
MDRIGTVLFELGELPEARQYLEHALRVLEEDYGPDDPEVAKTLRNLAAVQLELGEFGAARQRLERSLALDEAEVARVRERLAFVLRETRDYAGAKAHLEQAVAIHEVASPNSPRLASALNRLGFVLWDDRDLASAKGTFERARVLYEQAFGPEHPDVARTLTGLGQVLLDSASSTLPNAARRRPFESSRPPMALVIPSTEGPS